MQQESNGSPVYGIDMPHPQEAEIRGQNYDRIARRKAAAALAASVAQTSGSDLNRRNPKRIIGGTYEALQRVPDRIPAKNTGLSMADLQQFINSFNFAGTDKVLATNQFFTSFGPGVLGLLNSGQNSFGS